VVAVGAAGLLVGWIARGDGDSTATATITRPTPRRAAVGLPAAVERTRGAVQHAAAARNYAALRRLVPRSGFTYSYGAPAKGDAVAYWRRLEADGQRPLETLAKILELPYSLRQGLYVWPFAYGLPRGELTRYERILLGPLARSYAGDDYYGWRTGIRPDGRWRFFVAGD